MMFRPLRRRGGILDGTLSLGKNDEWSGGIPSTTNPYTLEIKGVRVTLVYKGFVHHTYPESEENKQYVFNALCAGDDWKLKATSKHGGTITLHEDCQEGGQETGETQ